MKKKLVKITLVIVLFSSVCCLKRMKDFFEKQEEAQTVSAYDGASAFVSQNRQTNETETVIKIGSDDANLYSKTSINSSVVSEINRGEFVTLVKEEAQFYYVITDSGNRGYLSKKDGQRIEQAKQTTPSSLSGATIVVNPGHGGEDTGASSNSGQLYEKELTLATALVVKAALEAEGSTVILTRENDKTEALGEIVEVSNTNAADIFISLHYDSSEYANEATGTTTYYYYEKYRELAQAINQAITAGLPLENRGIEYGNFQVLRENLQPSLLIELGYMNTDYDLSIFQTYSYKQAVAEAIVTGLKVYFQSDS